MAAILKGQFFSRQAHPQGDDEKINRLTPFCYAILACETCVEDYLKLGCQESDIELLSDYFRRMRQTYPKKLVKVLPKQYCMKEDEYGYEAVEAFMKMYDPLKADAKPEIEIMKLLNPLFDGTQYDILSADEPAANVLAYYRDLRIWSLGLALTFLDPKVNHEAKLLRTIRKCQKLKVGKDFKINYPAVLDPKIYHLLKSWWKDIEEIGLRESRELETHQQESSKLLPLKLRKEILKHWRQCDININQPLVSDDIDKLKLMFKMYSDMPIELDDSAHYALFLKYIRGIARHTLDDYKAVTDFSKNLKEDLITLSKNKSPIQRLLLRAQLFFRTRHRLPPQWALPRFLTFLENVHKNADSEKINSSASDARAAVHRLKLHRYVKSNIRDITKYLINAINEIANHKTQPRDSKSFGIAPRTSAIDHDWAYAAGSFKGLLV